MIHHPNTIHLTEEDLFNKLHSFILFKFKSAFNKDPSPTSTLSSFGRSHQSVLSNHTLQTQSLHFLHRIFANNQQTQLRNILSITSYDSTFNYNSFLPIDWIISNMHSFQLQIIYFITHILTLLFSSIPFPPNDSNTGISFLNNIHTRTGHINFFNLHKWGLSERKSRKVGKIQSLTLHNLYYWELMIQQQKMNSPRVEQSEVKEDRFIIITYTYQIEIVESPLKTDCL